MIAAVDTSALLKLAIEEAESDALRHEFAQGAASGVTYHISALAVTEMRRAARRLDLPDDLLRAVLEPFTVVRLSDGILQLAGRLPGDHLRTLDAIHLASALLIEAQSMVAYDRRLLDATGAEGLALVHPGA